MTSRTMWRVLIVASLLLASLVTHAIIVGLEPALKLVTGALLGAAISVSITLLITRQEESELSILRNQLMSRLEELDLRGVPETFQKAAKRERHNLGYYRKDCKVTIELIQGNLHFCYSSTIVAAQSLKMPKPVRGVHPPGGLSFLNHQLWHDGKGCSLDNTGNSILLNDGETKECYKISYQIKGNYNKPIKDDHRWSSSVENGFKVTARLPDEDGYTIEVSILAGDREVSLPRDYTPNKHQFDYSESLFSHQGFQWEIIKTKKLDPDLPPQHEH